MKIIHVPTNFLCAMTGRIMLHPVKAADGNIYEYTSILDWYAKHDTSPTTGQPVADKRVIYDHNLCHSISEFISSYKETACTRNDFYKFMRHDNSKPETYFFESYLFDRDKKGRTPLHVAAAKNNRFVIIEILQQLDDSVTAKLLTEVDLNGQTPLHRACAKGNTEIAEFLIYKGASLDCKDNNGDTPLHCAAMTGNAAAVKLLLDKNASFNCTNINGLTPLMSSVRCHNINTANILMTRTHDFSVTDIQGMTLLHHATNSDMKSLSHELIESINVNIQDTNGNTALHLAARNNCAQMIIFLLSNGADASIKNSRDQVAANLVSDSNVANLFLTDKEKHEEQPTKSAAELLEELRLKDVPVRNQQAEIRRLKKPGSRLLNIFGLYRDRVDEVELTTVLISHENPTTTNSNR